ncbi:cysteine desulfurase [Candidatus Cytomitobacter primus]|nr:cysteine desulfurase [Candidatus Cytomitobacter primus]
MIDNDIKKINQMIEKFDFSDLINQCNSTSNLVNHGNNKNDGTIYDTQYDNQKHSHNKIEINKQDYLDKSNQNETNHYNEISDAYNQIESLENIPEYNDFQSFEASNIYNAHNKATNHSNDMHHTNTPYMHNVNPNKFNSFNSNVSASLDVYQIREDFPILHKKVHGKPLIWLDNGATSQKPKHVIDAISTYYSQYNSNVHRGVHTLSQEASDLFDQARETVASFINASSATEIIFTKGATEGLNLISNTIGKQKIQAGDEILITQLEHHSNILPWRKLAQEHNAHLKIVPINANGDIMLDAYSNLLNSRTKIVALSHVANSIGALVPIENMIQQAKAFGAITVIDGAQSIPHMKIDVQKLDCDFFIFSGHKMFAPTGTGVVYGKEYLLKNNIPYQVGGGMIQNVTYEDVQYADSPYIYEAGTANLADIEGLRAAINYLDQLDMNKIEQYEHQLVEYAYEQMSMLNHVNIIGNPSTRVGVISFIVHNMDNNEIGRILDKEGIAVRTGHHCAQPAIRHFGVEGTVRASFAFYNTYEEVDKLIEILRNIC